MTTDVSRFPLRPGRPGRRAAIGLAAIAALLVGVLSALWAGPAASAEEAAPEQRLIEVSPSVVTVPVPGPGHSASWQITVRNVTDRAVPLGLLVTGDEDSVLFRGPTPLLVSVADASGRVILSEVPGGDLLAVVSALPELPGGDRFTMTGTVRLPSAADNRYAEASGSLRFEVTAMQGEAGIAPPPGPEGRLSETGGAALGLIAAALTLVAVGILAVTRARRRSDAARRALPLHLPPLSSLPHPTVSAGHPGVTRREDPTR